MKKILLLLFVIVSLFELCAQSALGRIKLRPEYWHGLMNDESFEKLKGTKTFFVRPKQFTNDYTVAEYIEILDQAWTVSPVTVIDEKDLFSNIEVGNIIIRYKSVSVFVGRGNYVFNYFKFGQVSKKKVKKDGNFKWWEDFFGIISFTADVEARLDMARTKDTIGGDLIDYRLGYLKNYLQQMNTGIKNSANHDFYDYTEDKAQLKKLKELKLYIPDNILYRFNAFTGKERERPSEELLADYTYPFEVIDENELSTKILNAKEPFYYLMYHQKNARKIITIVDGFSGEIIYRTSKNISYNLKPKDIKQINKAISKS